MKSLPLPFRVAAGLAAMALERARDLPAIITGFPVTVASQALQVSMRVQQHVTELAIKGDEALASLRPVDEAPEWATFDEDVDDVEYTAPARFDQVEDDDEDPWSREEHAIEAEVDAESADEDTEAESTATPVSPLTNGDTGVRSQAPATSAEHHTSDSPAGLENYDELSLPQLRARLRGFSVSDLEELLAYERERANRPAFVGMLTRRIETVRDQT